MTAFRKIRSTFFWINDGLQGGGIRQHYSDIEAFMQLTSEKRVQRETEARLDRILKYAVANTQYYSGIDLRQGIQSFPVVDKNIIRKELTAFFSSRFHRSDLIPVTTSGSTGTPFTTFHSRNKRQRNTADTLYFASVAGYTLGDKLYYLKIWSDYNRKSRLIQRVQNIVPIDVLNLSSEIEGVIKQLNSNYSPVSLLGYVSALETICKALDKGHRLSPRLKVNSIITMSESLNDYTRASCEKYFSCPVISRYSNIENGIIAQQTLAHKEEFTINRASYYVEILNLASDERVPNGTLGRIVVTDYFNEGMPLIRYDTGDFGVIEDRVINGIKQQVLARVEGRRLDQIYNTKGQLVSSYIVYKNMWKYTELDQYQLAQTGPKSYQFRLCSQKPFLREDQLKAEFMQYLGADADFRIKYVQDIPLLDSGKRKKVVNEMNLQAHGVL